MNENMMENKTYTPLYMEYLSYHVAYPFWLLAIHFQDFHVFFYLFMSFRPLYACLGIKKASAAYLILWKRGARWRVVQGTSAAVVG